MGKTKTKSKSNLAKYLILAIIFLSIILVVLINFTTSRRKAATESIEADMVKKAETYAGQFYSQLNVMEKMGVPIGILIDEYVNMDEKMALDAVKTLKDYSDAYLVIYSNPEGQGFTHEGVNVNLSNEPYFGQASEQIVTYSYIKQECIEQREAIVITMPFSLYNNLTSYILMYFPIEHFSHLLPNMEHDGNTFYLLVENNGNIIKRYRHIKEGYMKDNLFDFVQENSTEDSTAEFIKNMGRSYSGSVIITKNGVSKKLVYAPIGINGWYFVMGVNDRYIKNLEAEEWKETKDFMNTIIIIMAVFIVIIIIINGIISIKQKEHNKTLEMKSETDLLTNIFNKITTERKIKEYMENYPDKPAMMFVLDIDNFKKINDTMGHAFGDEVLKSLGYSLKAEFRVNDIVGRNGGDEFVIFLKDIKDSNIQKKEAERVAQLFKNFQVGEYAKYNVTASIGAAVFGRDGTNFETLYKAADSALYKAKQRGKNQLAFYREEEEKK